MTCKEQEASSRFDAKASQELKGQGRDGKKEERVRGRSNAKGEKKPRTMTGSFLGVGKMT